MFQFIAEKLQGALKSLTNKGLLTEADVDAALRELRVALLEADVALPAIKHLLGNVREKAIGGAVLTGVNPGQQVVKIVYDELVALLGEEVTLNVNATPPAVVLMAGLQGSGKTTSAAKIAEYVRSRMNKKVGMASLDVYRPAAIEQLAELGRRIDVPVLQSDSGKALERAKEALDWAKVQGLDVLFLDTAGRTELNAELMDEVKAVAELSKPVATLLVADAQTGHSAVQVAEGFKAALPLTGLVLTRLDGDARGGAALSMRFITGVPIVFLGTGEQVGVGNANKLEAFRPDGLAGRILGQGDVISLVEKVAAATNNDEAAGLEKKILAGGTLNMDDLAKQLRMMQRMGGMAGMLDLMPGMGALKDKVAGKVDDKMVGRQLAIISSMTKKERKNPLILNAKRRIRIAKGSGTTVNDVNKLVKLHEGMAQMAKMMKGGGIKNIMNAMKGVKGLPR